MSSLQAIGYTLGGGTSILVVSFLSFGIAVRCRSVFIAPRCTARPPETIHNPNPTDDSQRRGNPVFGWIHWLAGISYETMLRGVPGTGTRNKGLEGDMLKVNLDGIVLLRFIDYGITTLANIPDLVSDEPTIVIDVEQRDVYARLYIVVFSFWFICYFACKAMEKEWAAMLALRRVYFLESDVYQNRQDELKETLYRGASAEQMLPLHRQPSYLQRDPWIPHAEQREVVPNIALYSVLVGGIPASPDDEIHVDDVKAAIKRAKRSKIDWQLAYVGEYFDKCVPNQPGYSSSVAAITILPSAPQLGRAWSKWYGAAGKLRRLRFIRKVIGEKLHYSIDLDDVNVLDDDDDHDDANGSGGGSGHSNHQQAGRPSHGYSRGRRQNRQRQATNNTTKSTPKNDKDIRAQDEYEEAGDDNHHSSSDGRKYDHEHNRMFGPSSSSYSRWISSQNQPTHRLYTSEAEREKAYYQDVFGASPEEIASVILNDDFGPEQTAAYSREFAQSAAACCPNGCCEGSVRRARIDRLREMEEEAEVEVHAANLALKKAQRRVIKSMEMSDHSTNMFGQQDFRAEHFKAQDEETGHANVNANPGEGTEAETSLRDFDTAEPDSSRQQHNDSNDDRDEENRRHARMLQHPSFRDVVGVIDGSRVKRRVHDAENNQWARIESIMNENKHSKRPDLVRRKSVKPSQQKRRKKLETGVWALPKFFGRSTKHAVKEVVGQGTEISKDIRMTVEDHLLRESTYAVVTFTSRQAAVAARQCLSDGRGLDRWKASNRLPIPPLADVAPCSLCPCRGCCRPVTLTITDGQKAWRRYVALLALGTMYVSYTFPLLAATSVANPERLGELIPEIREFLERNVLFSQAFSGIASALIYSTFFGLCPVIFKFIANFGSNAPSVYRAEYKALSYYWYFMLVTAFTSNLLWNMTIQALQTGLNLGTGFAGVVRDVAQILPTVISSTWLNWCILRTTMILPVQYLLQFNTFLFTALGWKCCARMVRGGGPGGPVPYRIYVDSGVVFLCSVALAPAAPLVAPAAFLFFVLEAPILKRNLIFMYRPKYDSGGRHWPFLFDVLITSLVVGQIFMCTMMALRGAVAPTILSGVIILPTILFRLGMHRRYLQAYRDASLFHTSELDGWDVHESTSILKRQHFRRFLVDAHKAAYVPVCLANSDEVLTVEPALVVPIDRDEQVDSHDDVHSIPPGPPQSPSPATPQPTSPVQAGNDVDSDRTVHMPHPPPLPPRHLQPFRRLSSASISVGSAAASVAASSDASHAVSGGPSSQYPDRRKSLLVSRSNHQFGVSVRRIAPSIQLSMETTPHGEPVPLSSFGPMSPRHTPNGARKRFLSTDTANRIGTLSPLSGVPGMDLNDDSDHDKNF